MASIAIALIAFAFVSSPPVVVDVMNCTFTAPVIDVMATTRTTVRTKTVTRQQCVCDNCPASSGSGACLNCPCQSQYSFPAPSYPIVINPAPPGSPGVPIPAATQIDTAYEQTETITVKHGSGGGFHPFKNFKPFHGVKKSTCGPGGCV